MRRETLVRLAEARRHGQALVRALDTKSGKEILIDPVADPSPLGLAAAAALARDASGSIQVEGRDWFLTVYNVPWEIVIIGAVHIAQALGQLALAAGYRVRVIDPRPAYATPERFAGIRLIVEWPDEVLKSEPLTARSALVVLAHDPKIDDPALAKALAGHAGYIGALGSDRTHARRLARLRRQGFSDGQLARIHGPVGLGIGARSPSEIAIAILAELVQVRRTPKAVPRVGGVVLAAGLSHRMGFNKMIAEISGRPLVRHAVDAALDAGLDPVVVVTGHEAAKVETVLAGLPVAFAHNPDFARGLSTSLRCGIAALPPDCVGAMILLGDMPDVDGRLAARLCAAFDPDGSASICVAGSGGRRGHPVIWARKFFTEIAGLDGDAGARVLMDRHGAEVRVVEANDDGPIADIDTPADLEQSALRTSKKPP